MRNQIVVRADQYATRVEHGRCWLSVPGLEPRQRIAIPLDTVREPAGTLRLVLRGGVVEVHYQIDETELRSSARPCGSRTVGIDKGYTEAFVDSDGDRHGEGLGELLRTESDRRAVKGRRRAKLRSVAENAAKRGDHAKADRIARNNLGTVKRERQTARFNARCRTLVYTAAHSVDKASHVVSEDLSSPISGRSRGRVANRRLAAWTKGLTAQAVDDVTRRRGSASSTVNAAYTSQVDPRYGIFGSRANGKLHCFDGVVYPDDHAAALNVLARLDDPEITRWMPWTEVRRVVQERTERHRLGLLNQDPSCTSQRGANHPNPTLHNSAQG